MRNSPAAHRRTWSLLLGGLLTACASAPPADSAPDPAADTVEAVGPVADPAGAEPLERPERALLRGLAASARGDFEAAVPALSRVAEVCAGEKVGDHALLAALALLVDPRNPARDLERARGLATRYLSAPSRPSWIEPAVEALYLAALDLGGAVAAEPVAGEEPDVAESSLAGDPPVATDGPFAEDPTHRDAGTPSAPELEPASGSIRPPPEGCDAGPPELATIGRSLPALPGRPMRDALTEAERDRAELRATLQELERHVAELQAELARIKKALEP